jgi:ABC-type uncharacterized transport system ATPase subunit
MNEIISVKNVAKSFKDKFAVNNLSFSIRKNLREQEILRLAEGGRTTKEITFFFSYHLVLFETISRKLFKN